METKCFQIEIIINVLVIYGRQIMTSKFGLLTGRVNVESASQIRLKHENNIGSIGKIHQSNLPKSFDRSILSILYNIYDIAID